MDDEKRSNKEILELKSRLDSIKSQSEKGESNNEKRSNLQIFKIDSLIRLTNDLQYNLEPFIQQAKRKYPSLNDREALEKFRNDIRALEAKTVDLEKKVRPRELTSIQQTVLVNELSKTPAAVFISGKFLDVECANFVKQLDSLFRKSGWKTVLNFNALPDFKGISVFSRNPNQLLNIKDHIKNSFQKVGFQVLEQVLPDNKLDPWPTGNYVVIVVSEK